MELTTRRDIRLVGRAMREDWPTSGSMKQEAIDALMEVIRLRDPELSIEAFKALVKADESNIKRKALELKEQDLHEQQRLRLIELAQSLGPQEVARLASESGVCIDSAAVGRADAAAGEDESEAC